MAAGALNVNGAVFSFHSIGRTVAPPEETKKENIMSGRCDCAQWSFFGESAQARTLPQAGSG